MSSVDDALLRIGVDTGGTFTDLILMGPHQLLHHKLPSTPDDPSRAVLQGIHELLKTFGGAETQDVAVVHGSTVATNAILEGKGARAAFVTTAGFEDTLLLARQHRPALYALEVSPGQSPLGRDACYGVPQRHRFDGTCLISLRDEDIEELIEWLKEGAFDSVAISFLHSYAAPEHELRVAERIRAELPSLHITLSHELLPEFREYERASTCVLNALVAPKMNQYIRQLEESLGGGALWIMGSGGGSLPPRQVMKEPVRTVLSGPAGGIHGAKKMALLAGCERFISFDMGGTSTDVSLCEGEIARTTESEIAGMPLRIPMLDIHTVGAGGGSLAWLDAGGALRVGPQSAGARPGPACYGHQKAPFQATVTDAHVFLGHIQSDLRLGGHMQLHPEAAKQAITELASQAGLSPEALAVGILRIAGAKMTRAIQRISVQKGHDPRTFSLLPFGGAGGLHACQLAEELGMKHVIVPQYPGLLSAFGMLLSAPMYDVSRSLLLTVESENGVFPALPSLPEVQALYDALCEEIHAVWRRDGLALEDLQLRSSFELRYAGQSYEINIPYEEGVDVAAAFEDKHLQLYGYTTQKPLQIVTLRVQGVGRAYSCQLPSLEARK
ncbi:MAG TPA: 5-oxoprolinase, partial [Myxococcales bacterium]|nr:5-oxoprolinase [Myxococcales bacterium]